MIERNPLVQDDELANGAFYQCDSGGCGLRFPVNANDPFANQCPRCGGVVTFVGHFGSDAPVGQGGTSNSPRQASQLSLILDNWRSNFNVGAAFRTADGAAIHHIYLCGISPTPASQPKLAKTALGAESWVSWSYHPNAVAVATRLQQSGAKLWVLERRPVATSLLSISTLPVDAPVVLVAGNEIAGVDPGLVEMADQVVELPMMGRKQSLNVAVALSIATYWLRAIELTEIGHSEIREQARS